MCYNNNNNNNNNNSDNNNNNNNNKQMVGAYIAEPLITPYEGQHLYIISSVLVCLFLKTQQLNTENIFKQSLTRTSKKGDK